MKLVAAALIGALADNSPEELQQEGTEKAEDP